MPDLHLKRIYRVVLVALLILVIIISVILIFLNYPFLRTTDNLNLYLTSAIAFFAFVEILSIISKNRIEKKRRQTVDLRNELEKLYGPVYSILNNIVLTEIRTGILSKSERILLDETFSKKPFVLPTSQEEWRLKIRNLDVSSPIPMKLIKRFVNEYEQKREQNTVVERFSNIYSVLKNVRQKIEEVGLLLPSEKDLIDKKFSTYPFMLNQELYNYWNKEIRSLKILVGYQAMEHRFTLIENLKLAPEDAPNSKLGPYRVPKAFIDKFLEEYDNKVSEYRKF